MNKNNYLKQKNCKINVCDNNNNNNNDNEGIIEGLHFIFFIAKIPFFSTKTKKKGKPYTFLLNIN
jgi:hypothetical protein